MKTPKLIMAVALLGLVALAAAQDVNAIQERIRQRLPVITQLKAQQLVGENKDGYLEYVKPQRVHENVVNAENADRKALYQIVAQRAGASAEQVGQRRAAEIRQQAAAGVMVQQPDGQWVVKQ